MPLYVYECPVCGKRHEELRPYEHRDTMAPLCHGGSPSKHACHEPVVCIRVHGAIAPTPAIDHMGKSPKKEDG